MNNERDIVKRDPWTDYTNSVPVQDVCRAKHNDNNFFVLGLTQESIDTLPDHPDICYQNTKSLEAVLRVDVIIKYHKDCLWELEPATRYVHTGTRRYLTE